MLGMYGMGQSQQHQPKVEKRFWKSFALEKNHVHGSLKARVIQKADGERKVQTANMS